MIEQAVAHRVCCCHLSSGAKEINFKFYPPTQSVSVARVCVPGGIIRIRKSYRLTGNESTLTPNGGRLQSQDAAVQYKNSVV